MHQRLTKIICTLGPSSNTKEQIKELADCGMNIARINLSHGKREEHAEAIRFIKEINEENDYCVGILLDTKGSEIRTGDVQTPIEVKEGEELLFCPPFNEKPEGTKVVEVNYDGFSDDVTETDSILIDNGELSFDIGEIHKNGCVTAKAREDGEIGSRRHINLPGADVDLPTITEKDWSDIEFATEQEVDFIALSFVRSAQEVQEVLDYLEKQQSPIKLITKIETAQSVDNIAEIVAITDGVMVARGDLGAEVPFERIPAIQDEIVTRCLDSGKPVIMATHMLESMREHPIPTRAEMTDVAHAATMMADCAMLSGETASGKHPCKALQAMHKLLSSTEEWLQRFAHRHDFPVHDEYDARGLEAVNLAESTDVAAILVFTRSGRTAEQICKYRPRMPVVACTCEASVQRKMNILYSVIPQLIEFGEPEETIKRGFKALMDAGLAKSKDKIIVVSDVPKEQYEWSLQLRILP